MFGDSSASVAISHPETRRPPTFRRHVPTQTPEGALSAVKIVKRLRGAGFETYLYYSVQKDEIICKIR